MSELDVYLDGTLCGRLEQTSAGNLTFRYDDEYRAGDSPTPLSLSMPLAASTHKKRDLASYAAYWDGTARLDSAMNVGGEYSLAKISSHQLIAAGTQFGVAESEAADLVDDARHGVVGAFESARASIEHHGPDAMQVADDLLRCLRQLPLVSEP